VKPRWSTDVSQRWIVRGGIAVPLTAFALILLGRSGAGPINTLLLGRGALARSLGFDGVRFAYPPIPTFVASLVRGPELLVLAGCLFGAFAGLVVVERLWSRALPLWLDVLLIIAIMAAPATWYVITQDTAALMGLSLLIVAIDGFERFAMEGETLGGFVTGLALGAAVLCDPAAVVYALTLTAAAPLIAISRYRGERGVTTATLLVFAFPAFAALASWAFVEWRFTGSAFHTVRADLDLFSFPGGLWSTIGREARRLGSVVLRSPVFVAVGVVMALRRPPSMVLGYLLPLGALVVGWSVGLAYPDVLAVVLLVTLGAMTIPERIEGMDRVVVAAGVVLQVVLAFAWLPSPVLVQNWIDRL